MGRKNAVNTSITTQGTPSPLTRAGTAPGLLSSDMYAIVQSDFTLAAASGVQTAFPSTIDVWTLEASTTYEFWGNYMVTTGGTSHSMAMAFLAGGSLTFTSINYIVVAWKGTVNTTATAQNTTWVSQAASTVITAANATAGSQVMFKGIMRINAGGTVTPQINFSANPTGTNLMKVDSYIAFRPLGSNTVEKVGTSVA